MYVFMLKKIPISDKVNGNLKSENFDCGEPRWPLSNPLTMAEGEKSSKVLGKG
jgi:hypothetical protein